MNNELTISERRGVDAVPPGATKIYSVGISTVGTTEIVMAQLSEDVRIIATTIDEAGAKETQELIHNKGYEKQIEVRLEDVASDLPHADETFDYVYARLVLHYLTRQQLEKALSELHRILKLSGKLFIVIRSQRNLDYTDYAQSYDKETGMTTFKAQPNKDVTEIRKRYFHDEDSISRYVTDAGFTIDSIDSYDEKLFHDYSRKVTVDHTDNLIEVVASK